MKLDFDEIDKIPAINDRLATKEGFASGLAIFYQEGDAKPVGNYDLPRLAIYEDERGQRHRVVVIQVEQQIKRNGLGAIVCGAFLEDGGAVVCTINELEFVR